jgi:hypothetical protein
MEQWVIPAGVGVLGILGTINVFILNSLWGDIKDVKSEVKAQAGKSQSIDACDKARASCEKIITEMKACKNNDHEELWDAFNHHSHTGLDNSSKVTR